MISQVATLIFGLISALSCIGALFGLYDNNRDEVVTGLCLIFACVFIPLTLYFGGVITN
jgi:hypothetical protein